MRRLIVSRPSSFLRSIITPAAVPRQTFCTSAPRSTTAPSPETNILQPPIEEEPSASQLEQLLSEQTKAELEEELPTSQPEQPSPYTFPIPLAPSSNHTSLSTFLSYATRTPLDPTSTVYIGTHYEYTTILSLSRLCFTLYRVGGKSDCGIDLLGFWSPIVASPPLKVLVQCKVTKTAKPKFIRELEGAFIGAPPGWRGKNVIGALVVEKPATKGVRDAIGRSKWPMVYVVCSREGVISQMLWNQKAVEEGGLEGLGVGSRHRLLEENGGEMGEEVMLTWRGREVKPPKGERGGKKKED